MCGARTIHSTQRSLTICTGEWISCRRLAGPFEGAVSPSVPPAGFEPAISCVKGRRPRPLDHGGEESSTSFYAEPGPLA